MDPLLERATKRRPDCSSTTAYGRTGGRLQSRGDHVLVRLWPRVEWRGFRKRSS